MNFKLSSELVAGIFRTCIRRFPVSVMYITALTLLLLIGINMQELLSERFLYVASYYLSVGYLLSLTLHLWQEETLNKRLVCVINVLAHAALIVDAVYLYHLPEAQSFMEKGIAHASAVFVLWLSMFFLSFLKEKNNVASWNFTMKLLVQFFISHAIGLVMFLGLSLLAASFQYLFSVNIRFECYLSLSVLCCLFLSSCLFIGLIPGGEAKHDRTPVVSKFMNGVLHYLFLPLIGCYLVVLYVYAFRILCAWELPNGWLSLLVVALMAGCIGIEFGLYPGRQREYKRHDEAIARWLPLVILPLLALMTVGIVRRFLDYGISINRLYLATLNAWCYFVCIGLFVTKAKRINWITISFSIVFFLTSALPVNFVSITRKQMHQSLMEEMQELGADKLPMKEKEYAAFMKRIPQDRVENINDRMRYMVDHFGRESVADIADKDVSFWNYQNTGRTYKDYTATMEDYTDIALPKGYNHMLVYKYEITQEFPSGYEGIVKFVKADTPSVEHDTIYLDIKRIKNIPQPYNKPLRLQCSSSGSVFVLTRYNLTVHDDSTKETRLYFDGYLFRK